MRIQVIECIAGTTLRTTWVNSGVTPGSICSALLSGSETLVHSVSASDSGNGHYHALHSIPNSSAWYVNRWLAQIGAMVYENRQVVRAVRLEVD